MKLSVEGFSQVDLVEQVVIHEVASSCPNSDKLLRNSFVRGFYELSMPLAPRAVDVFMVELRKARAVQKRSILIHIQAAQVTPHPCSTRMYFRSFCMFLHSRNKTVVRKIGVEK